MWFISYKHLSHVTAQLPNKGLNSQVTNSVVTWLDSLDLPGILQVFIPKCSLLSKPLIKNLRKRCLSASAGGLCPFTGQKCTPWPWFAGHHYLLYVLRHFRTSSSCQDILQCQIRYENQESCNHFHYFPRILSLPLSCHSTSPLYWTLLCYSEPAGKHQVPATSMSCGPEMCCGRLRLRSLNAVKGLLALAKGTWFPLPPSCRDRSWWRECSNRWAAWFRYCQVLLNLLDRWTTVCQSSRWNRKGMSTER